MSDWHESVYRKVDRKPLDETIRLKILERDRNKCVVCDGLRHLEIHHVVPRSEGGGDNRENLITLCRKCHDEVELSEYRTVALIRNHTPEWKNTNAAKKKRDKRPADTAETEVPATHWQSWVYGGAKNPQT